LNAAPFGANEFATSQIVAVPVSARFDAGRRTALRPRCNSLKKFALPGDLARLLLSGNSIS
jgi:hypothetical protein